MSNRRVEKNTEKCQIFASSIHLSPTWNPQALLNPGVLLPQSVHFWPTASLFVFGTWFGKKSTGPKNRCSKSLKRTTDQNIYMHSSRQSYSTTPPPTNSQQFCLDADVWSWEQMGNLYLLWKMEIGISRTHKNFLVSTRRLSVMQRNRTSRRNFLLKFWFLPCKKARPPTGGWGRTGTKSGLKSKI